MVPAPLALSRTVSLYVYTVYMKEKQERDKGGNIDYCELHIDTTLRVLSEGLCIIWPSPHFVHIFSMRSM